MFEKKSCSITVLMSVYKVNIDYLCDSIESILEQSFKDYEFIIIIDGIDQDIISAIKSYSDDRIRIYQNQYNIGLTKSLNIGLKMARGKYIARMDADDVSYKSRLQRQFDYMEKNSDVAVVGSYAKIIGTSKLIGNQRFTENKELLKIRLLFYNAGIIHPTAFFRKEFLIRHNIEYDEKIKMSQDYAMWVDIAKYGDIKIIPEVLLAYRRHDKQITTINNGEYRCIIILRQWFNLNLEFTEMEEKLISSVTMPDIHEDADKYNKLFVKLLKWNKNNQYFNNKYFVYEINRIWIHIAMKKFCYNQKLDMIIHRRSLNLLKPCIFTYCLNFYLLSKLKPYFINITKIFA